MRKLLCTTLCFVLLFFVLPSAVWAAAPQGDLGPPPPPQGPGERRSHETGPEEERREQMEKDAAKKANEQRQAQLKRDTDKLFQLATDLKEAVDKSNENVLALDVVKKADEIEKLAHSVREKMKGGN